MNTYIFVKDCEVLNMLQCSEKHIKAFTERFALDDTFLGFRPEAKLPIILQKSTYSKEPSQNYVRILEGIGEQTKYYARQWLSCRSKLANTIAKVTLLYT